MEFVLYRDVFERDYTLGRMSVDGRPLGYTCEDTDRKLEEGGTKIPKRTAIPRGRYRIRLSMSGRFGRIMPEIVDVPGFSGIRIHGGNTHEDTEGCPLLGRHRMNHGVFDCAEVNDVLVRILAEAEDENVFCWIEIR